MIRMKFYKIITENNYVQTFETTACQYYADTENKRLGWRMNMHASSQEISYERIIADVKEGIITLTVYLKAEVSDRFIRQWNN